MFHSLYVLDVVKISPIEWAYANTLQKVAFLTLSFPLGSLIDRIKRKHVIILAHLLFIASTVLLLISRGYAQLLLAHLTFPLSTPLWNAYFVLKADMVQRDARGRVLGVTSTLANLASIPASGLAGFLYDFDPTYPFILTMILGVIAGAIVFLKVDEPKTRQV